MLRWLERVNFSRIIMILAITLGIALGLCGLNFVAVSKLSGQAGPAALLMTTAWIELAVMILSAIGLVLCVLGVVVRDGRSTLQRLFDDKNTDDKS